MVTTDRIPNGTIVDFTFQGKPLHGTVVDAITFNGKVRHGVKSDGRVYDVWPDMDIHVADAVRTTPPPVPTPLAAFDPAIQLRGYTAAIASGAPASVIARYNARLTAIAQSYADAQAPTPRVGDVTRVTGPAPTIDELHAAIGGDVWGQSAPTDRQRAEMYRAEISRLTSELKAVTAQRDSLALEVTPPAEMHLANNVKSLTSELQARKDQES